MGEVQNWFHIFGFHETNGEIFCKDMELILRSQKIWDQICNKKNIWDQFCSWLKIWNQKYNKKIYGTKLEIDHKIRDQIYTLAYFLFFGKKSNKIESLKNGILIIILLVICNHSSSILDRIQYSCNFNGMVRSKLCVSECVGWWGQDIGAKICLHTWNK